MSFQHWPAARAYSLTALTLATAALLVGCASPSDPIPRQHPIIPAPVQDLEARQRGNEVILTFTLPNRSLENAPLSMPPAIEIYLGELDPAKPKQKNSPRLVYTIPSEMVKTYQQEGRVVYRETIEPDELNKAGGETLVYEVRTREDRNRASAESNRVQVPTRIPPRPIEDLQAQITNGSVILKWMPVPEDSAEYRVYRGEITPASSAAAASDPSKADFVAPLRLLARPAAPSYTDR